MKKIYYRKLIRDKIPKIIHTRGYSLFTKTLDDKKFLAALLKKVGEEASALPRIKSRKVLLEELADIFITLDAIKKMMKITPKKLREVILLNRRRKGDFKNKLFLIWSSDTSYKTNEK